MEKLTGYPGVSNGEQDAQLQFDALQQAECDAANIFGDQASGSRPTEP